MNKPLNQLYCKERTGLCVSPLGFGGAPLAATEGTRIFTPLTDDDAIELVHRAVQQGIRLFDTAPSYGFGLSEERLGKALKTVPRDQFVIETKYGLLREGKVLRYQQPHGSVRQSLEESLSRLGLETIDIFLMHDPDQYYEDALNIVYPQLEHLRDEGLIKAIGAGMNQWEMLDKFLTETDCDVFMLAHRYTLLQQSSLEFLNRCHERGISVHLAGIYQSGILATGASFGAKYIYSDAPDEVCSKVEQIEAICECYGVPIRAAAIQFAWAHPAVTSAVVGMSKPEEIYDNLGAFNMTIPQEVWDELRRFNLIDANAPTP